MGRKVAETPSSYFVDCTRLMKEEVWTEALMADLEEFLSQNIKFNKKKNNYKDVLEIEVQGSRVALNILRQGTPLSKKYIKYLVKKFLQKQDMRDMFRAISTSRNTYSLVPLPVVEAGMAGEE